MRGRLKVQKSQSVGLYGRPPGGVNVQVPSPSLEELTVHYRNETHTLTTKYRATTLGAPQRGQLLSPGHTEASWRALTAGQQFTPRQKTGEGNAHLSSSPRNSRSFTKASQNPGGKCTVGMDPMPAARRPAPRLCPPRALCWALSLPPSSCLGVAGNEGSCGLPGSECTERAVGLPFWGCRKTHTGVTWEVPRAPPQAGEMEAQVQATSAPALIFPSPHSGREAGGGRDPETHPFL